MTRISCESRFGRYVDVVDAATGEKLLRVRWANDETGEYAQYVGGQLVVKRGRIKVVYDGPAVLRDAFIKEHGE